MNWQRTRITIAVGVLLVLAGAVGAWFLFGLMRPSFVPEEGEPFITIEGRFVPDQPMEPFATVTPELWTSVITMSNGTVADFHDGTATLRFTTAVFGQARGFWVAREFLSSTIAGELQLLDVQPRTPDTPPYTLWLAVSDQDTRLVLRGTLGCWTTELPTEVVVGVGEAFVKSLDFAGGTPVLVADVREVEGYRCP